VALFIAGRHHREFQVRSTRRERHTVATAGVGVIGAKLSPYRATMSVIAVLVRRRRHHSLKDELLDPFAVLDLGDIKVSLGVDVHVMHDIELARRHTVAAE
jgi:hypothetical protein